MERVLKMSSSNNDVHEVQRRLPSERTYRTVSGHRHASDAHFAANRLAHATLGDVRINSPHSLDVRVTDDGVQVTGVSGGLRSVTRR
jgi:hypothetical protein